MKILAFNLKKVNAEKFSAKVENLKINTHIDVSSIEEVKSDVFKFKEEALSISFSFKIEYEPEYASIEIGGVILLSVDSKISREVLKQWKDKLIPDNFKMPLFNLILQKSSIRAIQLEEELNLPLHFQLPSLIKKD